MQIISMILMLGIQILREDDLKNIENSKDILNKSNMIKGLTCIKTNFLTFVESINFFKL